MSVKTSGANMVVMNKRAIEALLLDERVKLWPKDFVLDPLFDPIPAYVAANVLLVDRNTLAELLQNNLISATCRVDQDDDTESIQFSYWDILEATTLMSLVSLGDQIDCAIEDANRIFDLLAYHYEEHWPIRTIDVFMLSEIIRNYFTSCKSQKRFPVGTLTSISLKLAIDIMNVHFRCMSHFSCSIPSLCRADSVAVTSCESSILAGIHMP
jgi:hypothetical protein